MIIPFRYLPPFTLVLVLMVLLVFILMGPGILVGALAGDKRVMGNEASQGFWKAAYWVSRSSIVFCGVIAPL